MNRALASLLVVAQASLACKTAENYLDPRGPVYVGHHAQGREPTGGSTVHVVTFNIEYALRADRALVALRSHPDLREADVIALQEMDAPATETLARGLGLNYVYYPAALNPQTKRDVGDAILTPWPIESTFKLPLPYKSRGLGQSRAAVGALVRVRGCLLRVYSLHLGSPFGASPGQRRDQIDVVLCDAGESAIPVVIAGDFNSSAIGGRLVAAGYSWPTRGVGPTAHRFSFDHVFVRGSIFGDARAGVAKDVKDASDHRPVWVRVQVLGPPSSPR